MARLSPDHWGKDLLARFVRARLRPNRADVVALALIGAGLVLLAHGAREMDGPLAQLQAAPISLDPGRLPEYALRTVLRMFAALACSLVFTFLVATLAAKSRKAEMVIAPALDILQSVPVLGFLTFTVTSFMGLFPGRELGVECAAIFAIFTSQAWNMTFSFYQSLRTLPADLDEVARQFHLSPWRRFWRLEAPFGTPALVWNAMMSMSGGWFFVVASEAITVGNTQIMLPGIGSYLSLAISQQDFHAVGWAVLAMGVVIALYDQLLFRPIVAWADRFRFEQTASQDPPRSWFYDILRHTRFLQRFGRLIGVVIEKFPRFSPSKRAKRPAPPQVVNRAFDMIWIGLVVGFTLWGAWSVACFVTTHLSWREVGAAFGLGLITLVRVLVLIALASVVWVPIGVWIGLRPKWTERIQPVAQFLAAFPANVLFPFFVIAIVALKLDPNVWLSPLMILGTQWYILFNVIAGASALPTELKEAASVLGEMYCSL